MDLNQAAEVTGREDDGVVIELNDEQGNPADPKVTVTVAGTYSKRYRSAQDANRKWWRKHARSKPSDDVIDGQALELIAACIIAWSGFTADGKDYPLTKANAIHLLTVMPWVREQIETAMTDHEGFFSTASTN